MSLRPVLIGLLVLAACRSPGSPAGAQGPPTSAAASPQTPDREASASGTPAVDPVPLQAVEVIPGIFAVLQPPERRFWDSNAVLIVTDQGVAVIDGPQRLRSLVWLADQAEARSPLRRRVLITTHWHLDHSLGSTRLRKRFEAAGRIVEHWGHHALDPLLATEGAEQLEERGTAIVKEISRLKGIREAIDFAEHTVSAEDRAQVRANLEELKTERDSLEGISLLPPTHHVEEPTTVELGSVTLELVPLRAHTDADLVVHIPEASVLITGDVLDEIPFAGHGHPRRWLIALRWIQSLDVQIIIPGHGPVMGPEHVVRAIGLWDAVLEQARLAVEQGETSTARYAAWKTTPAFDELRRTLVSDPASERNFDGFLPEALDRAMADLRGELGSLTDPH